MKEMGQQQESVMIKSRRFVVRAICTISGSSLENITTYLWFGASHASAERAMLRLKKEYGSYYRNWKIVESTE